MSVYSNNKYDKTRVNDAWYKVVQFIPPKAKVLDIGCSSGQLGYSLKKEKGAYVVGLDIDKQDLELAKKNLDKAYLLNVEQDDLSHLGAFDIIIMADVIEHLVNPVAALKKVKQLLNENGQLVFSIPNMANITTRLELLKGRFEYKDFGVLDRTHLRFYDKQEVDRVFREAGLQITQTDCTLREIPENILRQELKSIGISLTPAFTKFLKNDEALTYQFVGTAVISKSPRPFTIKTTSPLDSVSRYIDSLNEHHQQKTRDHDNQVQNLQKEIQHLQKELEEHEQHRLTVARELDNIRNSRTWKLVSKIHTVRHKLEATFSKK